MKTILVTTMILVLGCGVIHAQDETFAIAQPSEEHGVLQHEVGMWDADITMTFPGQEPIQSKGSETCRMVGKFWVVSDLEYEFMGQEMGGHGAFGFDASTGKYVGSWMGSDNPNVLHMVGEFDKESKTMSYELSGNDQGGNPMKGKVVTIYVDDNHKNFELHFDMGDGMVKVMEIKYTKK